MSTAKICEFKTTIECVKNVYYVKVRVLKFDFIRQEWYWTTEMFKPFNTKQSAERFNAKACNELQARVAV